MELHRQWFEQSAMGDLLDEDYSLAEKNALYRFLVEVLKHKEQLFGHLRQRWEDLFGAGFEVLLYDLTSTYFESDPAFVWLMDRGIPTEEVLAEMRSSDPPIYYLVGPARTTQSHVAGKTAAAH